MAEPTYDLATLRRLTVAERIQLVGDLWDSVAADTPDEAMPMRTELLAELDRRIRGIDAGTEKLLTWEEARERIKLRKMRGP